MIMCMLGFAQPVLADMPKITFYTAPLKEKGYNYIELGAYTKYDPKGISKWIGNTPAKLAMGHRWHFKNFYFELEAVHISNYDRSGSESETWIDMYGGTIGIRF